MFIIIRVWNNSLKGRNNNFALSQSMMLLQRHLAAAAVCIYDITIDMLPLIWWIKIYVTVAMVCCNVIGLTWCVIVLSLLQLPVERTQCINVESSRSLRPGVA